MIRVKKVISVSGLRVRIESLAINAARSGYPKVVRSLLRSENVLERTVRKTSVKGPASFFKAGGTSLCDLLRWPTKREIQALPSDQVIGKFVSLLSDPRIERLPDPILKNLITKHGKYLTIEQAPGLAESIFPFSEHAFKLRDQAIRPDSHSYNDWKESSEIYRKILLILKENNNGIYQEVSKILSSPKSIEELKISYQKRLHF